MLRPRRTNMTSDGHRIIIPGRRTVKPIPGCIPPAAAGMYAYASPLEKLLMRLFAMTHRRER